MTLGIAVERRQHGTHHVAFKKIRLGDLELRKKSLKPPLTSATSIGEGGVTEERPQVVAKEAAFKTKSRNMLRSKL